jgi:lipoyl(octanoyl) transferase
VQHPAGSDNHAAMLIKTLGLCDYPSTYAAMRAFTEGRDLDTEDEIWLCEHTPTYTQGLAGREEHLLQRSHIPVVQTNRGGQITYHGPGQVVAYPLVDLKRLGIYVKEYVYRLEQAVIQTLDADGITGHRVRSAPGIYVRLADPRAHAALPPVPEGVDPFIGLGKIAALGVKVTQHRTYHGLALNVAMDLQPFAAINPCGYAGLRTVDLATLGVHAEGSEVAQRLAQRLAALLSP